MSTNFNPQQQQAINALGRNVIVSASAGAGKTTVLIARLMKRILQDGVHIQEVCALTFTEAAAQEMKSRLLKEFNSIENPDENILSQIPLVETADISTIHSFCLNIVKNHSHVIALDPKRSQNILDDAEVNLLKNEAFDITLQKWLETRFSSLRQVLDYFDTHPSNIRQFKQATMDTLSWMRSRKNLEASMQEVKKSYQAKAFNMLPDAVQDHLFWFYDYHLRFLRNHLMKLVEIVETEANEGTKAAENIPLLYQTLSKIEELLKQIEENNFEFYDKIPVVLNFVMPTIRGSEAFKDAKKPVEDYVKTLIEHHYDENIQFEMMHQSKEILDLYLEFAQEVLGTYQNLKEEENALDFDDFEHFALAILTANDFEVAKNLQEQYKEIMVDEFQDTNEIQDEIIRLISNGHNLFRVGDIKQSIYRFRGAKPQIMKSLMEDENHQNLFLSFNYRSKEPIVEFNNKVFDILMNTSVFSEYTEEDHVDCGLPSQKEDGKPVELHYIEIDDDEYFSRDDLKAMHIAQEIIRLHHEEGREFKEMTVLVRSHFQKRFLKKVFDDYHIPHYMSEPLGFFNSSIVQDTLAFMRYAIYRDDWHFASVLMSRYLDLSYDEIAKVRLLDKENHLFNNFKILYPGLAEQMKEMMKSWRYKDIVTIVQEIFSFNDSYHQRFSLQEKTNLDFLLDKAIQFQEKNNPSIETFLHFIDQMDDEKSSEASHLSVEDNVVEIMTVHQSKGLQFPVVFYWAGGRLSVRDHYDRILHDDELGIAVQSIDIETRLHRKNFLRQIIEFKQRHEELEEMLRLVYVALTRAQNHMIIVDSHEEWDPDMSFTPYLLFNYQRQIQLLMTTAPQHYSEIKILRSSEISDQKLSQTESKEIIFTKSLPNIFEKTPFVQSENDALDFSIKWGMDYGTKLHEWIEKAPLDTWNPDSIPKELRKPLMTFNQHSFTQELYQKEGHHQELPFLYRDSKTQEIESGIIDWLVTENDCIWIIDYKSDHATIEEIVDRYTDQLTRYFNALKEIYPKYQIKAYLYSFHHGDYIEVIE